jgi:uncharacterized protein
MIKMDGKYWIIGGAVLMLLVIAGLSAATLMERNNGAVTGNAQVSQNTLGTNQANGEVQNVRLTVVGGNYVLEPSTLKKGVPVRMNADLNSVVGCSRDIVISAFGVRKYVKPGDNVIEFTPTKTGTINIACSMNMYRGTFTVSEDGLANSPSTLSAQQEAPAQNTQSPSSGGSCGASGGGCGCGMRST